MVGAEPDDGSGVQVSPQDRATAVVRGGEEDPRAIRGPGQFRGPVLQPGQEVQGFRGAIGRNRVPPRDVRGTVPAKPRPAVPLPRNRVQRYLDHSERAGLVVGLVPLPDGHHPLAVRCDPRRGEVESRSGQQGPALARARIDDHDVLAKSPGAIVGGPSGDSQAAVRAQLEGVLVQGPPRLGGQVPRGDRVPGRIPTGATRPAPGGLGGQHVGNQEPLLVRAEIMIPVPDQGRFVQDGRHAGVGAGPALLPVRSGPGGAGQHRRGERGQPRAGPGGQPAEPPGRSGDPACLPAGGGQQPQGPLSARVIAGIRGWLRTRHRRRRAGGQEQHPAVRQEGGTVLTLGGPGQPGRRPRGAGRSRCRPARCWT